MQASFRRRSVDRMREAVGVVVALLLGVMFLAFMYGIIFRYLFNLPVGWASELSVFVWMWFTLLGTALWLKESEEIRFDLVSGSLPPAGRRIVGIIVSLAAVVLFGMSLPASWSYVTFMKVESASYLKIRLDILYSIYIIFAVAVIIRYAWTAWDLIRGEVPEVTDPGKASTGL